MPRLLSIGEFSRIAHLSVKTLRHYDDVGLLMPVRVDEGSGYRYYASEQLPTGQVIRRLRALEMSVPDVKAVLDAPSLPTRHALLARHLAQREAALAHAQATVDSLRALLQRGTDDAIVKYQSVPARPALAIRAVLDQRDVVAWWQGAIGELRATLRARSVRTVGPICGQYDVSLFNDERGEALVYAPVEDVGRQGPVGRVSAIAVPAAELAVLAHEGSHDDVDIAYAGLARHVIAREVAVEGPIREAYLRDPIDYPNPTDWLTEIGWPIFRADSQPR
jgi:DNA-binding transcriptional MerR regulator